MGQMKELAIKLQEMPTVYLVGETLKRLQAQDCQLVSSNELQALATAVEVELINRMQAYQQYPEIDYV